MSGLFDPSEFDEPPASFDEAIPPLGWRDFPCPTCGAPRGRSCRRPSGHRAMTAHAERVRLVERKAELLRALPSDGDGTVPPEPSRSTGIGTTSRQVRSAPTDQPEPPTA